MFGAKEPSARPAAQDMHPRKMDARTPKRFTKAPITGPKNMNTAIVIELTQAARKNGENLRKDYQLV